MDLFSVEVSRELVYWHDQHTVGTVDDSECFAVFHSFKERIKVFLELLRGKFFFVRVHRVSFDVYILYQKLDPQSTPIPQ